MSILDAFILSLVEGVTEFLPISSTGHLNLASTLLGIEKNGFFTSFEIYIQLGAVLAVCALYGKMVIAKPEIMKKIIAGFIPTAIIGLILYKFIKHFLLGNDIITLIALLTGGIALIILELMYKEQEHHVQQISNISYTNAILIGIAQSLAIIPGISRSAATIFAGLFLGIKRRTATEFSFLLATPTMLAATVLDLKESSFAFSSTQWMLIAVGFIGSFIIAFFAMKWLLKYIQTHTFIPFGIYRIILALLFFLFIIQ